MQSLLEMNIGLTRDADCNQAYITTFNSTRFKGSHVVKVKRLTYHLADQPILITSISVLADEASAMVSYDLLTP